MKYVIDSYAWIEYFMGTKAGEKVKPIIEGLEEKITPTICLAEVYAKTIAIKAAKIDVDMKKKVEGWGLADSIVYATGLIREAKIVTGDIHFQNLKNVIFIKYFNSCLLTIFL